MCVNFRILFPDFAWLLKLDLHWLIRSCQLIFATHMMAQRIGSAIVL